MAISFKITDGSSNNDFELVYNSSTQTDYKARYGVRMGAEFARAINHTPDTSFTLPVNLVDDIRTGTFEFKTNGTDADDCLNNITKIKRMVDGADCQAFRWIQDRNNANMVYLQVQLNGATNATKIPVLFGMVDDSETIYTSVSQKNTTAHNIRVVLMLCPYGYGTTETVSNWLENGHFLLESTTSGLASGWNKTGTASLDTTNYLIGGQSQAFSGWGSGDYLRSDTVNNGTNGFFSAYIWGRVTSGTVTLRIYNTNTAQVIGDEKILAVDDANSISDKTAVDAAGNTWYRVPLADSGTLANSQTIRIECNWESGTAAGNIEGAMIMVSASAISPLPSLWSSYYGWENRNDQTNTATDNINWIDVWGCPGDVDGLISFKFTQTTVTSGGGGNDTVYCGMASDGKTLAADLTTWIDSSNFSTTANITDVTTNTGYTGSNYKQWTANDTSTYTVTGLTNVQQILRHQRRVFGRLRGISGSSGSAQLKVEVVNGAGTVIKSVPGLRSAQAVSSKTAPAWDYIDFGLINGVNLIPDSVPDTTNVGLKFSVVVTGLTGGNLEFDTLDLYPTEQFSIVPYPTAISIIATEEWWIINQINDSHVLTEDYGYRQFSMGRIQTARRGNEMSRFWFVQGISQGGTSFPMTTYVADAATHIIEYIPLSRHLLGTI